MANNTLTALLPLIMGRALPTLRETCWMPRLVNSDLAAEEVKEIGDTIDVYLPAAVTARAVTPAATSPTLTGVTPSKVAISLNQWYEAPFHLTDKELGEIAAKKNFIPMQAIEAMKALANNVNSYLLGLYKGVYGYAGTAGTTPFATTAAGAIDARKVLGRQLCPKDNRRGVLNADAEANALGLATFVDAEKRGDGGKSKAEGEIGRVYGIDWYMEDQTPTHTAGTITTGLASKSATAYAVGVSSIVATTAASTGACALLEGDILLFAGDTQTYTLTAAATQASAASDVTLNFSPPLKVAIASATPGVAITVKASHVVNQVFHRDAYAFANRPLQQTASMSEGLAAIFPVTDPVTGLSIRLELCRRHKAWEWVFDVLYGAKLVRPELATRLAG